MNIEGRIGQFTNHFRAQVKAIRNLSLPGESAGQTFLYQKTLFATVLDCLAGIRFHKTAYPQLADRNRERFVRFVQEHGSWTDGNRVSTPFLVSRLEAKKLTGDLLAYVRSRLTAFNPNAGGSISLSHIDACLDELRPLVVTEHEERELREVQHLALLYRYRNHLVHEFREPGYGMEVFAEDGDEPCYHGYAKDPRFYLVYPVGLFQSLADSAITQIEAYFAARNLDPYERVGDTSRW